MAEPGHVGFHYTEEAMDRVRSIGKKNLEGLFNQLSRRERAESVSQLPDRKGFKKGSVAHTNEQIRVLIGQIAGKSTQEVRLHRNLNAVGLAWQSAAHQFTKLDPALADILNRWLNREDVTDIDEFYEDYADQLFAALRELTFKDKLTREEVQRFFDFSPFSKTSQIQSILETCKSEEQVNRDKKLSELPTLVDKAHENIGSLATKVEAITNHCNEWSEAISSLSSTATSVVERASHNESTLRQLRASITEVQTESEKSNSKLRRDIEGQGEAMSSLRKISESIQESVTATDQSVAKFQEKNAALTEELKELASRVEKLSGLLDTIQSRSSDTQQTKDQDISAKITESPLSLKTIPQRDVGSQLQTLSETNQVQKLLVANLECSGLVKSSAEVLAFEVLAALIGDQVPVFSGIHARLAAQACAMTVSGGSVYSLKIPVGIRGPADFGSCLREMETLASFSDETCCLIIEGINRSAFDAFGEEIVALIQESRLSTGASHRLVVMATATTGPASLPLSMSNLALGPAFSCDCLDWRTRPSAKGKPVGGRIPIENWQRIRSDAANYSGFNSEDMATILKQVTSTPNPMLRQTVHLAYRTLASMNDSDSEEIALRHLFFGWILPTGIAQEREVGDLWNLLSEHSDRLGECDGICARVVQLYEAGCL